jgi:hypothetical protein
LNYLLFWVDWRFNFFVWPGWDGNLSRLEARLRESQVEWGRGHKYPALQSLAAYLRQLRKFYITMNEYELLTLHFIAKQEHCVEKKEVFMEQTGTIH